MNILGIIHFEGSIHPAACLLQDGKIISFIEEERLVRTKQAKGYFPSHAISHCMKEGKIEITDIDYIAFGWDSDLYRFKYPLFQIRSFLKYRVFKRNNRKRKQISHDRPDMGSAVMSGLKSILNYHPSSVMQSIVLGLNDVGFIHEKIPPITFVKHHLAHAATAFYCSGFDESAILVFDGHGEQNTITIHKGAGKDIKLLKEINIPHSLGWFYSAFTEYLGWSPNEGEVKLMGLAPYGSFNSHINTVINDIISIKGDEISFNPDYFFYNKRSYGEFFSNLLVEKLGPPRGKNEEITERHKDIAFAVQSKVEEAGIFLSKLALRLAGSKNLCLSGGVALNCKMNGVIHESGIAENIFVQPVSYDTGAALGAAMVVAMKNGDDCRFKMDHAYYGTAYTNDEIKAVLDRNKINYTYREDVPQYGARLITEGKIVGWFQNRMEAGARALGGRSILADPRDPDMKDKVNDYVKFRENWRPFAVSILEENIVDYLEKPADAPFMMMAFHVIKEKINEIQSSLHPGDNTTRPQSVSRKTNPVYWELINEFKNLTGVPAVLNTSFNIKGEPIVCSPSDALRCFYGTGIDALIMGNYVVGKQK
jgi:carbamoyltransferase